LSTHNLQEDKMERKIFKLESIFQPQGDQSQAIAKLCDGLDKDFRYQTLLGVTGSGKTFTMAKVVEKVQKPTLIISHNKTLAAQLYSEFKEFFPNNAVHYFVSYYDYYQPEAYIPRTDTYIEKDASINEEIDRLRNAATSALLSQSDTLIVASVSCIYGLGDPDDYNELALTLKVGEEMNREKIVRRLIDIQYSRNDKVFERSNFRVRGGVIDLWPSYEEICTRIELNTQNKIDSLKVFNPLTGEILTSKESITIFPAKHFVTTKERIKSATLKIKADLEKRIFELKHENKLLEAERLSQRTNYDMEMLEEVGYCSGIENYSRYLSNRPEGVEPATLLDYFPDDFLLMVDESHMTIPQIRGMYRGDFSRKKTLVDFGFRLPSAFDNRPLRFPEFEDHIKQAIFVSATPGGYEIEKSTNGKVLSAEEFYLKVKKGHNFAEISEQVIRPTGLLDPLVEIRKTENQIDDLITEVRKTVKAGQRVLVTTLTKRMSEELAQYLSEMGIRVKYLHSEIHTLDRPEIIRELRLGIYDVLVGINLLREGIDLPEVSLVAILDADKEGFLRSEQALIQTIGRAARHQDGRVIMYADNNTGSMQRAIFETNRRRKIQEEYNVLHGITPKTIKKKISDSMSAIKKDDQEKGGIDISGIPSDELARLIKDLERKMNFAAKNLEFEKASKIRDQIFEIRSEIEQINFKNKMKS